MADAHANDDTIPFDEAMKIIEEGHEERLGAESALPDVILWAKVLYEEGTSGPVKTVEGILMDGDDTLTIVHPETGVATIIGDRFIVRVDVEEMDVSDDEEEDDDLRDQVDTSADRFRA